MQNRNRTIDYVKKIGDLLLLVLSFLVAIFLAKRYAGVPAGFLVLAAPEWLLLFLFGVTWNSGSRVSGLYDAFHTRSLGSEFRVLGVSLLLHFFLAVVVAFSIKSQILSRFFVLVYCALLLALLSLWKAVSRLLLHRFQRNGRRLSPILLVGGGKVARSFAAAIEANAHLGFRVLGFVAECPHADLGDRFFGTIDQLPQVLEREEIDEVVVALPSSAMNQVGRVIAVCENFPVRVRIIPDYLKFLSTRFSISRFGSFPVITLRANPLEIMHWRFCKRCFDLSFTVLLFVGVFSWLWPLLALLIKCSSRGPVFFKQERWGIKNKRIICYKFRSMVKESRDVDENGRYQQAIRDDPRVTAIGRFLRRSNLDELPQFINVLKGDMSIVGPRPHPTPMNLEVKDSIQHYQLRHQVRPGITGWAQVNGFRGETSVTELLRKRVEFDIWYIENWSFTLDLKIIGLTAWSMLRGDSAAY
jgi:putative colanic acid biosynthesis UDP-glucose lipid carrier transferase